MKSATYVKRPRGGFIVSILGRHADETASGPRLVIWTRDAFAGTSFTGGFLSQAMLATLAIPALRLSPRYMLAVAASVVSYALMTFVMTAALRHSWMRISDHARGEPWRRRDAGAAPGQHDACDLLTGGARGSAVFGIGWGIAGFCPGGSIPALGLMQADAVIFVATMIAGIAITRLARQLAVRPFGPRKAAS